LLAFSRHEPLTTQPVDINRSLEEMTEMLARTLGSDVRIGKDLTAELWRASTDRNQFELAILNLAINARDAMPLGGSLTICTRNQMLLDPRDGLMAGDYVSVAVTDVGGGMPPELLTRVLEPFFTTKELGKGTGLGLSMVADVTRQLGGGLTISSEVGKGTCVTLFLPRARVDAPALPSRTSTGAPSWSMAPACILLVDDDQDTRTAVSGYAAAAGHQVVAANSGSEALALLDAGRAVDIMVIDDTLPGVPTAEVIAQSLVRRPGMPVLVLSGQTTQSATDGFPVLAKPFRQEQFNVALTGLLERAPGSSNVVHLRQSLTG
jgi:CheY-like chemotaxis protein